MKKLLQSRGSEGRLGSIRRKWPKKKGKGSSDDLLVEKAGRGRYKPPTKDMGPDNGSLLMDHSPVE